MTAPLSDAMPCPRHPTRQPAPGLLLCHGCLTGMRMDLTYVEVHWHHLDQLHTAGGTGNGRTIHADPPAPCRIDVLDHQRDLGAILMAWTTLIVEDRQLSRPPTHPAAQARWIATIHLDWLAATDFADEARDEFHQMRDTLAVVIGDGRTGQRIACPLDDCGFPIRINVHDPEEWVTCRGCGVAWTSGRLLLHAVAGETEAMVDAEAITSVTGVSRSTLDRWARHGAVRRKHGMYSLGDVMKVRHSTETNAV